MTTNLLDPEHWEIIHPGNWGSARSDNKCIFREEQVTFNQVTNGLDIITEKLKEPIYGKGFQGNLVLRKWVSGMVRSLFPISRGIILEAEFVVSGIPQWPAIWLFFSGGTDRYFEIDIMERLVVSTTRLNQKLWASIWKGSPGERILHKERSIDSTYRDLVTARLEWSKSGFIDISYNERHVLSDHDDNIDLEIYRPQLIINSAYCGRAFPYCTKKRMLFHVTNLTMEKI